MSTRCQVQVRHGDEQITLYHHTDGYPSYMLPLFGKAYELSGKGWQAGRVGKIASFLCAADPGVFEPEEGAKLHGDIEWYYRIEPTGETHIGACPLWHITVYDVQGWGEAQTLVKVGGRWTLADAVRMAEEIEAMADEAQVIVKPN